jgi:chromate transport protein ChrA
MKKHISAIVLIVIFAFLIRVNSTRDWAYLIAAILASYIVALIVERFTKLTSIGRYIIYIIVGVPIMANIIPLSELLILTAAGLASTIFLATDKNSEEAKEERKDS